MKSTSLFLNGNEAMRIEDLKDERRYLLSDNTGMELVNKDEFISLFKHLEHICTNSWSNKVRKEYKEMKKLLNL